MPTLHVCCYTSSAGALELDSMLWRLRSQRVIIIIIIITQNAVFLATDSAKWQQNRPLNKCSSYLKSHSMNLHCPEILITRLTHRCLHVYHNWAYSVA